MRQFHYPYQFSYSVKMVYRNLILSVAKSIVSSVILFTAVCGVGSHVSRSLAESVHQPMYVVLFRDSGPWCRRANVFMGTGAELISSLLEMYGL